LAGAALVLPLAVWLWGFTVDDALITARVAAHIAEHAGARFNLNGPLVDAVTPFGFAHVLSGAGRGGTWAAFQFAKRLGLCSWLIAAALLALLVEESGRRRRRWLPFLVLAVSAPLAAWAVSGMETGLVTLLATLGLLGGGRGALSLAVAAAWRPELVPFALTSVVGDAISRREPRLAVARRVVSTLAPAAAVALCRAALFGRLVPLAFYAKPSDFEHGLRYALGAFVFTGLPLLTLSTPREFMLLDRVSRSRMIALFVHFFALVLAGGDWMSLYRLAVPVLPCAALLGSAIAERSRALPCALRTLLALAFALVLARGLGPAARRVGAERVALIAEARPLLQGDRRIAALDVGWVGAQSEAEVIDLAGVTDAQVAFFPGGHTSKRIPRAWLLARRPDAVLLLLAPHAEVREPFAESQFARAVEQRVAVDLAEDFRVRASVGEGTLRYLILEPKPAPPAL